MNAKIAHFFSKECEATYFYFKAFGAYFVIDYYAGAYMLKRIHVYKYTYLSIPFMSYTIWPIGICKNFCGLVDAVYEEIYGTKAPIDIYIQTWLLDTNTEAGIL